MSCGQARSIQTKHTYTPASTCLHTTWLNNAADIKCRRTKTNEQVLIFVCIGAAFTISMMWYYEYKYINAEQQAAPGPGLRGDGGVDSAPPVGGGGEGGGGGAGGAVFLASRSRLLWLVWLS